MENNNNITEIPIHKRYVLVFDVETTGLIPKKTPNDTTPLPITEYPYIIQFSHTLYDTFNNTVECSSDSYIHIPYDVVISEFVTNLTGISLDDCYTKGRDIVDVLIDFSAVYKKSNVLVAHNIDFDSNMIMIEVQRNKEELLKRAPECFMLFNHMFERTNNIERYCTMLKGIEMCNIKIESKTVGKPPRKKWPKLFELYEHLFDGEKVEGLHNSTVDVETCLKCYLKMRYGIV
uniref:Exonuclease domain-containing protein n=1 Tax=viral metagenome TaxID=1070528 RepID=A0A6C0HSN7_9ZZZZ